MSGHTKDQSEALRGFIPSSEGLLELIRGESLLKGTVYEPGAERRELMACTATAALLEGVIWPSSRRLNGGTPS